MPQNALKRTMFPLGDLLKPDVKRLAAGSGLERIARKRESTGICFVGKRNFTDFIGDYIADRPGVFQCIASGKVLGTHSGIHRWTLGQRVRQLGGGHAKPLFVARKCERTNVIFVASGTEHPALYTRWLYAVRPRWIDRSPLESRNSEIIECSFRFQHTKPLVGCTVMAAGNDGGLIVRLSQPQRAITPGQFAVFYAGEECLGSARIVSPGPSMECDVS